VVAAAVEAEATVVVATVAVAIVVVAVDVATGVLDPGNKLRSLDALMQTLLRQPSDCIIYEALSRSSF
jgi:hypothetical protein